MHCHVPAPCYAFQHARSAAYTAVEELLIFVVYTCHPFCHAHKRVVSICVHRRLLNPFFELRQFVMAARTPL